MTARITSLAVTPDGQLAVDVDRHPLRAGLGERLGGEHVLDLAGADAERERTEGAVGGGVAVAAHDRHPGLGAALLGPDHVHDALAGVAHRVVGDAELGRVAAQRVDLDRPTPGRRSAGRCARSGTLWSSVATVSSGRRTRRPGEAQPSNACGLVTSCTRWRSMYSRSGSPGAARTTWRSQTFSARVGRAGTSSTRILSPSRRRTAACCVPDVGIQFLLHGQRIERGGARQGVQRRPRDRGVRARRPCSSCRRAPGCRGRRCTASRWRWRRTACCVARRPGGSASASAWWRSAPPRRPTVPDRRPRPPAPAGAVPADRRERAAVRPRGRPAPVCRVAAVAARPALDRERGCAPAAPPRLGRAGAVGRARRPRLDRDGRGARAGRGVGERAGRPRRHGDPRRGQRRRSGRADDAPCPVRRFGPEVVAAASRASS